MRKKGFVPDASVSILLTVPAGRKHAAAGKDFAHAQSEQTQVLVFNPQEETLTIQLVRELIAHTGFARGAHEPQTLVVCAVHTAGIPAQNALLKIVEEPPRNTQIVLVTQPGHSLLPTLLSRCREILWTESEQTGNDADDSADAIKNTDAATAEAYRQLLTFLKNPATSSYNQLIDLAQQFPDVATARGGLKTILTHASNTNSLPTPSVQAVAAALTALENNGNVRLTLEHCFFTVKAAGSTQNR